MKPRRSVAVAMTLLPCAVLLAIAAGLALAQSPVPTSTARSPQPSDPAPSAGKPTDSGADSLGLPAKADHRTPKQSKAPDAKSKSDKDEGREIEEEEKI